MNHDLGFPAVRRSANRQDARAHIRFDARPRLRPLVLALAAASLLSLAGPQARAQVLPSGLNVVQGQASVATSANHMTVTNSNNAILNWNTFSIGAANSVRFDQPSTASQVLNRVIGNDPSHILGSLSSNGRVWLLNQNGVLFGPDARVDVAGLVASTLNLADADWMAGRYRFTEPGVLGTGGVVNQGELGTTLGGRIALLASADGVRNEGRISTPGGQVILAAGSSIELVDTGAPNILVRVDAPSGQALNLGSLLAASGRVDLHAQTVNQEGIIRADALQEGPAGQVVLSASDTLYMGGSDSESSSIVSATGPSGGHVTLQALGAEASVEISGHVDVAGTSGVGGTVQILGPSISLWQGSIDASGPAGGGAILVGGGHGDEAIPNARDTSVGYYANLRADATASGDGGRIVVRGDTSAWMDGSLSARGGPDGGDGGSIETHGGGLLSMQYARIDATAANGANGVWRIGSNHVHITDAPPPTDPVSFAVTTDLMLQEVTTLASTGAELYMGTIVSELAAGTDVDIRSVAAEGDPASGGITVSSVDWTLAPARAANLTLTADRNIDLTDARLVSTGAPLGITLRAAAGADGRGYVRLDATTLVTASGHIDLGGNATASREGRTAPFQGAVGYDDADLPHARQGVSVTGSTLDAGSGAITLAGASIAQTHSEPGEDGRSHVAGGVRIGAQSTLRGGAITIQGWADTEDAAIIVRLDGSSLQADGPVHIAASGTSNSGFVSVPDTGGGYFPRGVLIDHDASITAAELSITGQVDSTYDGDGSVIGVDVDASRITASTGMALTGSSPRRGVDVSTSTLTVGPSGEEGDPSTFAITAVAPGISIEGSGRMRIAHSDVISNADVRVSSNDADGWVDVEGSTIRGSHVTLAAPAQDGLVQVWESTIIADGGVDITADGPGGALSLGESTLSSGGSVSLAARGEQGQIDATDLIVDAGGDLSLDAGGSDGWIVLDQSTLRSEGDIRANASGTDGWMDLISTSLTAGGDITLQATGEAGWIELFGSPLEARTGNAALLSGVGGFVWIDDLVKAAGTLTVRADDLTLAPCDCEGESAQGARLEAQAPGDAIVLAGAVGGSNITGFYNQAGPSALVAPNGRWLVYATTPDADSFDAGGLDHGFKAYGSRFDEQAHAEGSIETPHAGNGLLFDLTPTASFTAGKVYDGSPEVTTADGSLAVTGFIDGDRLVAATGNFDDKDAGAGKAFTVDAEQFEIVDRFDRPVYGYAVETVPGEVERKTVVVSIQAGDKTYDAETWAPVAVTGIDGLVGAETLAVTATGTFQPIQSPQAVAAKDAATGKPVQIQLSLADGDNGGLERNYVLDTQSIPTTASILPKEVTVNSVAASDKTYDGLASATVTTGPLSGLVGAETLRLDAAGTFLASEGLPAHDAGNDKDVHVMLSVHDGLNGGLASNYTLAQPDRTATASILPRQLALPDLTVADKTYDGTASASVSAGPLVGLVGSEGLRLGASGRFLASDGLAAEDAGIGKDVSVTLSLDDGVNGGRARNYTVADTMMTTASILQKGLSVSGVTAADKTYDASDVATITGWGLAGIVAGDDVFVSAGSGAFSDPNAGRDKTVRGTASALGGADTRNYRLESNVGLGSASVFEATLTYVANPQATVAGGALPPLSGTVTGFAGGDTLETATTGTLQFATVALPRSPVGQYGVAGFGLASSNYVFVQHPDNAGALTVLPALEDPGHAIARVLPPGQETVPLVYQGPGAGRTLDVLQALSPELAGFRSIMVSSMSQTDLAVLLLARDQYKQGLFRESIEQLERDASLADLPRCETMKQVETGDCLITEELREAVQIARGDYHLIPATAAGRPSVATPAPSAATGSPRPAAATPSTARPASEPPKIAALVEDLPPPLLRKRTVRDAALPQIERKVAVLIGVDSYADTRIPILKNSGRDARAVADVFESSLGYETIVLDNPTKSTIIKTLNKLASEVGPKDSVVVYYAGHGAVVPGTGLGYWQPSDANASRPQTWLSNSDIGRLMAQFNSSQVALISDSCFSGTLVSDERIRPTTGNIDPRTVLEHKSAVVMSSGGNEPVFDEGKNGHSPFAWNLMNNLSRLSNWQPGGNVFERVRFAVARELPQRPQYGAYLSAGHQPGGDYLFEQRAIDR